MAIATALTLAEAHAQMTESIKAVTEAAVDHDEAERDPESGTWAKSQTYAVLLHKLDTYRCAARIYDQVLAKSVLRG